MGVSVVVSDSVVLEISRDSHVRAFDAVIAGTARFSFKLRKYQMIAAPTLAQVLQQPRQKRLMARCQALVAAVALAEAEVHLHTSPQCRICIWKVGIWYITYILCYVPPLLRNKTMQHI